MAQLCAGESVVHGLIEDERESSGPRTPWTNYEYLQTADHKIPKRINLVINGIMQG
jgi:hypothetical protein